MAIAVDHGKLRWDDRIVDFAPDFQLKDAWMTHEFHIIAQAARMALKRTKQGRAISRESCARGDLLARGLERARPLEHFPSGVLAVLLGIEHAPAILERRRHLGAQETIGSRVSI